jgi:O-antigen/teichoic acid export membrane protein
LATASCTSLVAILLLGKLTRSIKAESTPAAGIGAGANRDLRVTAMLKESSSFLWLRLVTRIFQSIPIVMFGRMFGSEVVGVIGVFSKITEWLNFPFSVIGNALAVRAAGLVAKGRGAVQDLWDALSRFMAVSLMFAVTIYLGSDVVAAALLPSSGGAGAFIAVLAVTIFCTGTSSIVAPMSDYVGALRLRNILLSVLAFLQVPVIWLGAHLGGAMGALIAHVLVLALMTSGYVIIAQRAFFSGARYRIRAEATYFICLTSAALLATSVVSRADAFELRLSDLHIDRAFVAIASFWSIVLAGLLLNRAARLFFLTRRFFTISAL